MLGEVAEELWNAYPSFVTNGDRTFTGKTISPEDFEVLYTAKLQKSKFKHEEVMKALREQTDNGTLGMGLKKWFETEQWKREDNTIDFINHDL